MNNRILLPRLAFVLALASLPPRSRAQTIVEQASYDGSLQIQAHSPLGQSFTATADELLGFEFIFMEMNHGVAANLPITLSILEGAGTGGAVLSSVTLYLPDRLRDWAGASFALDVVTGQTYTAVLSTTTAYWGVRAQFTDDLYLGGQAYHAPFLGGDPAKDFAFRATFSEGAAIPEPATAAALAGAVCFAGSCWHRRRRRRP